jgi:hypothetical protein
LPPHTYQPTQLHLQWVRETLSLGVKWKGHEVDQSPPSSTKVKNMLSYTSFSPYNFMVWCLIKYRNVFAFIYRKIMLSVVLCAVERACLRKEHKVQMFRNKVLGKYLELRWMKCTIYLYRSPIVMALKSGRL